MKSLRAGIPRRYAAASAGIHRDTLTDWCNADPAFAALVEQAEDEAVALKCALIHRAAAEDWKAAAWSLARMRPAEFGERSEVDVTVQATVSAQVLEIVKSVAARPVDPEAE